MNMEIGVHSMMMHRKRILTCDIRRGLVFVDQSDKSLVSPDFVVTPGLEAGWPVVLFVHIGSNWKRIADGRHHGTVTVR